MHKPSILVLDEGTTSTRAILFSHQGKIIDASQRELHQHYPASGWVEHDANEIWEKTLACARDMVGRAGGADRISAIGITNQRETVVAWDRKTGEPVGRAIVWQDRRTADYCQELRDRGLESTIREKAGLELDPYFSASKIRWLLDHSPDAAALGDRLAVGTIESWLVWKLTGGLHISDATNASRTMLLGLSGASWDDDLLEIHRVPKSILPEVVDCTGQYGMTQTDWFGGPIAICGMAGDQQAATLGHGCLEKGQVKCTLGTGAFVLASTGHALPISGQRLLGTILVQIDGERTYALEGSVFAAGSLVKWLRDQLGMVTSADETETLARSVTDNAGICIVPALSGLGAPYWCPEARGSINGLTYGATRAHIVRAVLEAIAHQVVDLEQAYRRDGLRWNNLRIDGGMSANNWIAQDLADMLDLPVQRPVDIETTALGAAMLASVGCGLHPSLNSAIEMRATVESFDPSMHQERRNDRLERWHIAIDREIAGLVAT